MTIADLKQRLRQRLGVIMETCKQQPEWLNILLRAFKGVGDQSATDTFTN